MWPIGTSSSDRFGKSGCHIRRETVPCSALTPLACRESFSASTVMQNGSLGSAG